MNGTVGSGRAGLKLDISLFEGDIIFDAYYMINALDFEFYFQTRLEIHLPPFIDQVEECDIVRMKLFGFYKEVHYIKRLGKEENKKKKGT